MVYQKHVTDLTDALHQINPMTLHHITTELAWAAFNHHPVFVAGNGASAALSQHWACDHLKGASSKDFSLHVTSLASNMALLTAIGNDISFDQVFAEQLRHHTTRKTPGVLVLISASGKSPNVVNAALFARAERPNLSIVTLTGFDGGPLQTLASIGMNLHVPLHEYEAVEDAHCVFMHVLAKSVRARILEG